MQQRALGNRRWLFLTTLLTVVLCSCHRADPQRYELQGDYRLIAHALGAWHGQNYLNCLQCFWANYQSGFRYFEVDLWPTADGVVAFHEGEEARLKLPQGFTKGELERASPFGATLIGVESIAEFLAHTTDAFVITDAKSSVPEVVRALCEAVSRKGLKCEERVIPQIYDPAELPVMKELGFRRVIFTLYRFGNFPERVIQFAAQNPEVAGVTIPYTIF